MSSSRSKRTRLEPFNWSLTSWKTHPIKQQPEYHDSKGLSTPSFHNTSPHHNLQNLTNALKKSDPFHPSSIPRRSSPFAASWPRPSTANAFSCKAVLPFNPSHCITVIFKQAIVPSDLSIVPKSPLKTSSKFFYRCH